MANSILELIFKTQKQGQGGKAAAKELKEVKSVVGELTSGFLGFNAASLTAAGAVVAVAGAMKKGFDMGREGANLQYTADKFDKLSVSMGRAGDVMLNDLRDATRGMVADSELVSSAGDIMSLGLMKSADGVVRLTKVAGALNMDMNQLVLTLSNKTTMRFDQLGVKVDGFRERMQALQKTGMSVDDAFGEAFLQQAEAQVALVGERADSGAAAFDKLDVATKNWSDNTKKQLAPAATAAAEAITGLIDRQEKMIRLEEERGRGVRNMTRAQQDAAIAAMELGDSEKWVADNADLAKQMISGYGSSTETAAGQVDGLATAQDNLNGMMKAYNEQMVFNIASEGLDAEAKMQLALSMGLVDEKSRYAIVKTQEWREELQKGMITVDEYNRKVAGLAKSLAGIQSKRVIIETYYIEKRISSRSEIGGKMGGEVSDFGEANGTDGWVTVPPGHPGDSYLVPMSSGESYQVVNDRQRWTGQGGGQGGGVKIEIGQVVIQNEMDYQTFKNRLMRDIQAGR